MSNQLSIFNFEDHQLRTLLINGEPWFVAQDACKSLNIKNVTQAIERLDDDERSMLNIGRQGEANIINESGLFTLILRCRDAVNKGTLPYRFRKWVTGEVLPTIRKTGKYELPQKTTVDQRTPLRDAVNLLVSKKGLTYSEAYSVVHQRFNVSSIEDLPQDQLPQAVEYVHRVALEGEYIAHTKDKTVTLSLEEVYHFSWLYKTCISMRAGIAEIVPALKILESKRHGPFYSMIAEHKSTLRDTKEILLDKLNQFGNPTSLGGRNFPKIYQSKQ